MYPGLTEIRALTEQLQKNSNYEYKEVLPHFPGGDQQFIKYLYDNLRYPFEAYSRNVQGQVKVSFTVSATGKVDDVKIVQSINRDLDREAFRLVSMMPEWVPGYQNDKAVPVVYTVPIYFSVKSPFSKSKKKNN